MSLPTGIPAPLFSAPSPINPAFAFGSLGGRYLLLAFLPPPGPERAQALKLIDDERERFAEGTHLFFGVLPDEASFQIANNSPGMRWFSDVEGRVRTLYRAVDAEGRLDPQWVIVDPSLRILGTAPLSAGQQVVSGFLALGHPDDHTGAPMHAPVLIAPRIFEPEICRELIALYNRQGGTPSGVMRQIDGRTVGVLDSFKSRNDALIRDEDLRERLRARIRSRLLPELQRAFCFSATRVERYIVACYDAQSGGYFKPHRDNTTAGTAHRQFAVSINLNAEDYEGGDLRFPEFGSKTYRPPTGGAVVFSCSMLHEATPVTRGVRYAFLPFLFNEAGQAIREKNQHLLDVDRGDRAAG